MSKIEWCEQTWNPTGGCSKAEGSQQKGCKNCYAMRHAHRNLHPKYAGLTKATAEGPQWTGVVRLDPDSLRKPLRRRKPTLYFVNSMSDLFHETLSDEDIAKVFAVMAACQQHRFIVLTKRAERMWDFCTGDYGTIYGNWCSYVDDNRLWPGWPLPNVALGVSASDQDTLDARIGHLLDTPAAARILSLEPLLGPVDCRPCMPHAYQPIATFGSICDICNEFDNDDHEHDAVPRIHQVIVGGESGPGARPMHPDWVRSMRDQCLMTRTPFFFKQWGEWAPTDIVQSGSIIQERNIHWWPPSDEHFCSCRIGKKAAGRELDGRTWDEPIAWPEPAVVHGA